MSTATLNPERIETLRQRTAEPINRVPQIAERLDVSADAVYRLIREGKLRAIRVGRLLRIPESALTEFLAGGADDAE